MEQPETEPTVDLSEVEFDHEELRVFWDLARFPANLNAAPTYFGPTTLESVPPPAWAYGDSAVESDAFVEQVRIFLGRYQAQPRKHGDNVDGEGNVERITPAPAGKVLA